MTKADASAVIRKGDIIGFDSNGDPTTQFANSILFGIKSSQPCLVGGDSWSYALGERTEYAADVEQYDIDLHKARSAVDRVAFWGQLTFKTPHRGLHNRRFK